MKTIHNNLFIIIFVYGVMGVTNLLAQTENNLIPPIPFGCTEPVCDDVAYTLEGNYVNDLSTFKSDNGTLLNGLEFQTGNNVNDYFHPLVLVSGNQINISLSIEVNCVDFPSSVLIRGRKNGQILFSEEPVNVISSVLNNKSYINYLKSSTINLQQEKVDLVDLDIDWEISFGNGEWDLMGNSSNKLYVTWKNPKVENSGFSLQQSNGYEHLETVFQIGCQYAKNQTTEDEIIDAVWNYFKQGNVNDADGNPLHFYNNWGAEPESTTALIQNKDGQCYSWVGLFLDVLKSQGLAQQGYFRYIFSAYNYIVTEPIAYSYSASFLVNNWSFTSTPEGAFDNHIDDWYKNQGFTYVNVRHPDYEASLSNNIYNFTFSDVTDAQGINGQNTENPLSDFGKHVVARVGEKIYDSSYGGNTYDYDPNTSNSFLYAYQLNNIDGHYFETTLDGINEQAIDIDLNGDGLKEPSIMIDVWLIRKSSSTNTELSFDNLLETAY